MPITLLLRSYLVALVLLAAGATSFFAFAQGDKIVAIKAARLIDGKGRPVVQNGVVLVKGELIEAVGGQEEVSVPAGAEVIDLGDETIMPGLIDGHAHLSIRPDVRGLEGQLEGMKQPDGKQMLRAVRNVRVQLLSGVTTLYVVGEVHFNDVYIAEAVSKGLIPGPRIFPSGNFITTTAGHGPDEARTLNGPWEMRKFVRWNVENGAHHMKLTITDRLRVGPRSGAMFAPGESNFTREEIQAAVDELHRLGLKATAHANGESIRLALEAGVDSIQHGYNLTDELIELFLKHGKGIVNTHTIAYQIFFDDEWSILDNKAKTIKDWLGHCRVLLNQIRKENPQRDSSTRQRHAELLKAHRRGVPIAVGTDSMHGLLPLEIENLVEAGFTPLEAIAAATGVASQILGLSELGTLEKGKLADLISVKGDPSKNIQDLANIHLIMIGGERYDDLSFR